MEKSEVGAGLKKIKSVNYGQNIHVKSRNKRFMENPNLTSSSMDDDEIRRVAASKRESNRRKNAERESAELRTDVLRQIFGKK